MKKGLTLIELLVGVAVVSILIISILVAMRLQLSRSRDAQRKSDLEKIKISFEDYYNDNGCYPPSTVLEDCGGASFAPYLRKIPCDPVTKIPYVYLPLEGSACKGYRVLAALEDPNDPIIKKLGCDTACGCGFGSDYNYGVSSGVGLTGDTCEPLPSPVASASPAPSGSPSSPAPSPSAPPGSPLPTPSPIYVYACDSTGNVCNEYNIETPPVGCPNFATPAECMAACTDPANRCN